MKDKDFEEIWKPVKSVIDHCNLDYPESVTIGSQFGKLKSIILEQQEKIYDKQQLQARLSEAESLLYDARNLLNNVHCYETEVYKEIGIFLNGEEEECCEDCDETVDDCQCEICDICNGNLDYNGCSCEVCDCGSNLDNNEECTCDE